MEQAETAVHSRTSSQRLTDNQIAFPTKPTQLANHQRSVNIITNLYQMKIGTKARATQVSKYVIKISPELPDNSKVLFKLTKAADDEIKDKLKHYMAWGNHIYSPT